MSDRWWLAIEDDEVDVMALQRGLRQLGQPIRLSVLPNGFEPLAQLRACCSEQGDSEPELIVLDINLPLASGHEILREFRADAAARRIPVVILTTSDQESDVRSAYDEGAAGYFVKSPDFPEFVESLSRIVDYWSAAKHPT